MLTWTGTFLSAFISIGCSCEMSFQNVQCLRLHTGSQYINTNNKWLPEKKLGVSHNNMWLIPQAAHSDGERQDLCSWERSAGWGGQSKGGWSDRIFFSDLLKNFQAVSQWLSLVVLFQNINVERSVSGASQPDWFSFCQNGRGSQPVNLKTLWREIKQRLCFFILLLS